MIKLCRPYRAKTKGKVERFNGYLRRSFYVPLAARLKQAGLSLDALTANIEVQRWLKEIANERIHATTQVRPAARLPAEGLQSLPRPWRGDIRAARPQHASIPQVQAHPVMIIKSLAPATPPQHPLAIYERLLEQAAAA